MNFENNSKNKYNDLGSSISNNLISELSGNIVFIKDVSNNPGIIFRRLFKNIILFYHNSYLQEQLRHNVLDKAFPSLIHFQ